MIEINEKREPARTSTLFRRLFQAADLNSYFHDNASSLRESALPGYLMELCARTGKIRNQVILRAGIDRSFGYQIFRGIRRPSRDMAIRLAFGFSLDVDETQRLLAAAEKNPLYPRIKRDAAVLFCIRRRVDITELQAMLQEMELGMLDGEAADE